jgi:hypothetical protein
MLWFWLVIMWLSPTGTCLLFVWFSADPNLLTAASGAMTGMLVALLALFIIH